LANALLAEVAETLRRKQDTIRTSAVSAIQSAGDGGRVRLDLPLTHALLGEMVGSERETVTRAVDQLESAGFLSREGSHYRLHVAPDALAR
jgi:CRP-like cAMP-binding protein